MENVNIKKHVQSLSDELIRKAQQHRMSAFNSFETGHGKSEFAKAKAYEYCALSLKGILNDA